MLSLSVRQHKHYRKPDDVLLVAQHNHKPLQANLALWPREATAGVTRTPLTHGARSPPGKSSSLSATATCRPQLPPPSPLPPPPIPPSASALPSLSSTSPAQFIAPTPASLTSPSSSPSSESSLSPRSLRCVLNVGFGMGIFDKALQAQMSGDPHTRHYIIEAHPGVWEHMQRTGWTNRKGVVALFGRWQTVCRYDMHRNASYLLYQCEGTCWWWYCRVMMVMVTMTVLMLMKIWGVIMMVLVIVILEGEGRGTGDSDGDGESGWWGSGMHMHCIVCHSCDVCT